MVAGDFPPMNCNGWWGIYPPPNYYYYYTPPMPTGWICPRCGMVNAPTSCTCAGCCKQTQYSYTCTTGYWSGNTKPNPFYYTGDCSQGNGV